MKTTIKVIFLTIILGNWACEDVIEEDISDDTVQMIAPAANSQIESNVVTFQWNALKGADDYRLQIYGSNQAIVLDSLIDRTTFTYPLIQGNYQWRVRGENFAYESAYSFPTSFSVVETDNLTNQQVILSSPIAGYYTNAASLNCSWQAISAADTYTFELVNVTNGQSIVYLQSDLTTPSISLNSTVLTEDAEYQWKVKAVNSSSQSGFMSRNFFIDRTNPNQPQNNLPVNNATLSSNQTTNFSWSIPADSGAIQSAINYVIEFSNDIGFTSIIQTSNVQELTFQQQFTATGVYYWRVKAKDLAGNSSVFSAPSKFTIN